MDGESDFSESIRVVREDQQSQSESYAGTDMQREDATSMSSSVIERAPGGDQSSTASSKVEKIE